MERNALLLYLKNIRDLEFAQIKIQQLFKKNRFSLPN